MDISYNWLKDLIQVDMEPAELARQLTRVGLAVEGLHTFEDDTVLDIDLTSNRPDCLSHNGIAREISAITGIKPFYVPPPPAETTPPPYPSILAADVVSIREPALCHRFVGRVIKNVKIGPSPEFLVKRLEAIGERSINNVADITNYVMHEIGQPMHAFDLDKLAENRVIVRLAAEGEKIRTLDGEERGLDEQTLVICDAEKPAAVAGIMGGLDSSITNETTNVLLEVAYFDPVSLRRTSRTVGLSTEASYRFERGVDIEALKRASDRAVELIVELAGGEPGDVIDIYPLKTEVARIASSDISASVERLTGLTVSSDDADSILAGLGIVRDDAGLYVSPTWRHDIRIEEDLVEEVTRLTGYENIDEKLPPAYGAGEYQPTEQRKIRARNYLVDLGFNEAITYSFIDTKHDGLYTSSKADDDEYISLRDAIIDGSVRMRSTLLPGALDAVRLNLNQNRRDLRLFEIGKVFWRSGSDNEPTEREMLSIVLTGGNSYEGRAMPDRQLDFYDLKGAVEGVLGSLGAATPNFRSSDVVHLRPGQSASILIDEETVGYLGRLSDDIAVGYKFKQPVYVAEIDLDRVFSSPTSNAIYKPLAKYPSVVRDVSFVVKRDVALDSIMAAIRNEPSFSIGQAKFVDIFEGRGLADDERSLTVRFEYRHDERTLTEDEVENVHQTLLDTLSKALGISPRS